MRRHCQIRSIFLLFIVFSVCLPEITTAQISVKGIPESFNLSLKNAAIIPLLQLDSLDLKRLLDEDKKYGIDNRYGVIQQCSVDIKKSGLKTLIPGKGAIWQYKIASNNCFSLGIFFNNYNLPKGASVFIYDSSKTQLAGAFTKNNNNSVHQLPVAEFQGNNLIIEYFEPFLPEFSGELELGSVSQSYNEFQSAAVARIGINCPQGNDWQDQKASVCLMTFNDTKYSYYCTGSLKNNVREDETPYFLTANHCINTEAVAKTMITYFNYENSTCSSSDASKRLTLAGATLKSGNTNSDFSLLLLNEYPDMEYHPYFAGWNVSGINPE